MQITLDCLRSALGERLGMTLTPELAAQIEFMAFDRADHAIAPEQFAAKTYRDCTFQVESFRTILPELHRLHELHFAETEKHLQGFALRPNYDYVSERERVGGLVQFTARNHDGELIGNLRMYVAHSLHTGNLFAEEDTFYLLPEYRKGYTALCFLRYAEECLVQIVGVKEIRANSKVVNNAHRLMEFRSYKHFANQYIKTF